MRRQTFVRPQNISDHIVEKIARAGIFPLNRRAPDGEIIRIGEQPFMVTGEATREEFDEAVQSAGLAEMYTGMPASGFHFLRVTTD